MSFTGFSLLFHRLSKQKVIVMMTFIKGCSIIHVNASKQVIHHHTLTMAEVHESVQLKSMTIVP